MVVESSQVAKILNVIGTELMEAWAIKPTLGTTPFLALIASGSRFEVEKSGVVPVIPFRQGVLQCPDRQRRAMQFIGRHTV
jgi:hypothetical protein